MNQIQKGIFYGVGVGPGDPELMTLKAARLIRESGMIAVPKSGEGDRVAYDIALSSVPELGDKPVLELSMPMTRDRDALAESHRKAAALVEDALDRGTDVVFLTLGDPTIYSTCLYVLRIVREDGYETALIPGVPSFCAAAARLGIGLAEGAEALHVIPASYQGADSGLDWNGTKVLMKTGKSMTAMKTRLKEKGLYENAKMVERCGMAQERVLQSLDEADDSSSYFSIVIVK